MKAVRTISGWWLRTPLPGQANRSYQGFCGRWVAESPFPWHPVDLSLKLALAPHSWFDPLLEWYTPAGDFSRGTYFGLARWRNAGSAGGYVATQNWKGEFRECEFPLEELDVREDS